MGELLKLVQELREAVEGKMVECPTCKGSGLLWQIPNRILGDSQEIRCENCRGTGRVSDPTFAGLLEVVIRRYPTSRELGRPEGVGFFAYETRSYEGLPEGCLAGALKYWATQGIKAPPQDGPSTDWWVGLNLDIDMCFFSPTPNETACEVVLKALLQLKTQKEA